MHTLITKTLLHIIELLKNCVVLLKTPVTIDNSIWHDALEDSDIDYRRYIDMVCNNDSDITLQENGQFAFNTICKTPIDNNAIRVLKKALGD